MITIDISKSDYQSTVTTYKTMDSCKSDPLYIETTDGMYQLQNFDKTLSTYDLKSRSVSGKIKVLNAAGVSAIKKECDLSILSVGDVVDRKKCGGSNKDLYSTWEIRGNLLKVAKCTSQKDGTSSEKRCTDTTGGVWFD